VGLEVGATGVHFSAESGHAVDAAFHLSETFACVIDFNEFLEFCLKITTNKAIFLELGLSIYIIS
jgi:hypothetical protein